MPSVLIVDDNLLARQGLKHLLSQEQKGLAFGEARTAEEAVAALAKRRWDIVVIEASLPGYDGFQILQEVRRSHPAVRVVMLSSHTNPEQALQARQSRASGYVGKNSPRADVLRVFRSVLAGKNRFVGLPDHQSALWPLPEHLPLSTRERDVLLAFVAGKRVSEIAAELNLSVKTISTYKRRILDKLQLSSIADLVRYAIEHKLA